MKTNQTTQKNQALKQRQIESLITAQEINTIASEIGVEDKRGKKLLCACFVYLMFLSTHLGKKLTFDELAVKAKEWDLIDGHYQITGRRINEQLGERGEAFAKALFGHLLQRVLWFSRKQNRAFRRRFRPILLQDSTVIRLCEKLVDVYTGTHDEAALKLHVRYEYYSGAAELVDVSSARKHDSRYKTPKKYGKNVLWLIDLGYYDTKRFETIRQQGQYFVSRLKHNAHLECFGHHPTVWDGNLIKDMVFEEGQTYDFQGFFRDETQVRVVGIWNEEKQAHWWYITNLSEETFKPKEIAALYRLRWDIEIFFRDLKQVLGCVKILNQKDKSKIRSQLYYIFCYYLLIQFLRVKAAHRHRVSWHKFSFVMCERLFRCWFVTSVAFESGEFRLSESLTDLFQKMKRETYKC